MFFRQARVVCCIFYDIHDINQFIDKFGFADYEYAYIYHDKDLNEDGSQKEPHYHFYGSRKSPITEQSLKNFAKTCQQNIFYENIKSNKNAFIEYLTHSNNPDKYQYPKELIVANFDINEKVNFDFKLNPAEIISLYDEGFSTLEIIKKYPKLIYSIANLQRYERLLHHTEEVKEWNNKKCQLKQVNIVTPFDDTNDVF